jgi:geranylgeranyl diphosphate synthase type I
LYKEPINEHQAILVADLLFNWAFNSFFKIPQSIESITIWKTLLNEVTVGQLIDLDNRDKKDVLEKDIVECMLLKTARYTCTRPLELGIALSGQKPQDWVYSYGDNLGVCFQITDDLIDIMSEDDDLGKHGFTDITEGQPTLINAKINNQNDKELQEEFNSIFGSKNRNLITKKFKEKIRNSNLIQELRSEVFEKLEIAKKSIEKEDIKEYTREDLLNLVSLIEKRTS